MVGFSNVKEWWKYLLKESKRLISHFSKRLSSLLPSSKKMRGKEAYRFIAAPPYDFCS